MAEDDKTTRTGEGIPVGPSREEERLDELGINAEQSVDEAQEAVRQDTVLQRTEDGYEETSTSEIPLSDATGEGRLEKRVDEENREADEDDAGTWHNATRQQGSTIGTTSPRDEASR